MPVKTVAVAVAGVIATVALGAALFAVLVALRCVSLTLLAEIRLSSKSTLEATLQSLQISPQKEYR